MYIYIYIYIYVYVYVYVYVYIYIYIYISFYMQEPLALPRFGQPAAASSMPDLNNKTNNYV